MIVYVDGSIRWAVQQMERTGCVHQSEWADSTLLQFHTSFETFANNSHTTQSKTIFIFDFQKSFTGLFFALAAGSILLAIKHLFGRGIEYNIDANIVQIV